LFYFNDYFVDGEYCFVKQIQYVLQNIRNILVGSHFIRHLNPFTLMNFLKKLFSGADNPQPTKAENKNPDNTRLIYLLDIHGQHPSNENYRAVLDEITTGNSFLLLPSVNENGNSNGWKLQKLGQ
jgi:hypothetical protein